MQKQVPAERKDEKNCTYSIWTDLDVMFMDEPLVDNAKVAVSPSFAIFRVWNQWNSASSIEEIIELSLMEDWCQKPPLCTAEVFNLGIFPPLAENARGLMEGKHGVGNAVVEEFIDQILVFVPDKGSKNLHGAAPGTDVGRQFRCSITELSLMLS